MLSPMLSRRSMTGSGAVGTNPILAAIKTLRLGAEL